MTDLPAGACRTSADQILQEVADAVRLQEGPPGVRSVLRAIRRLAPASTKEISRATSLPVPIVAAVGNELRRRDVLTQKRPSRLTPAGLSLLDALGMNVSVDATCQTCDGRELVVPSVLDEAVGRLRTIMETGPEADMSLDQSLCTPETKVRRVLSLFSAGVLPGGSLLLIGDDDLVSLAVALVGEVLGTPLVERLTVVDVSPEILGYIAKVSAQLGTKIDTVEHDLRQPLPDTLCGQFDAAMTDPPYTPEGARLFLSRAVEGLRPGPANSVFFSFGAKSPDEMLEVQQEITDLGLVTNGFIRNFNDYEGSGILGGSGFYQHLLTTSATQSLLSGDYAGPLYTRDKRARQREYECVSCGARFPVGPGAQWASVRALRAQGCPGCGGGPFKPRQLIGTPTQASPAARNAEAAIVTAPVPEPARDTSFAGRAGHTAIGQLPTGQSWDELRARAEHFVARSADENDLDAIAAFETEIARVSFGSDAVDNPQRHRARLARAMQRSRAGMFVARRVDDPAVIGWLWMSINQNTMTGNQYANFRSLAVAPVDQRAEVAEMLIATGLDFAAGNGLGEVIGRVYAGNVPMRALYRKFGFEATHMAMKLRLAKKSGRNDDPDESRGR